MVSRLERGRIAAMAVGSVREIAQALDAEVLLVVRWRGGELDRLMDEGHATLVGRAVEILQSLGWETRSEVSYLDLRRARLDRRPCLARSDAHAARR